SPDGKLLASGSFGEEIRLWEVATKSPVGILKRHSSAVTTIALSPDGRLLASGSFGEETKLWDMVAGGQFKKVEEPSLGTLSMGPLKKLETFFRSLLGGVGMAGFPTPIAFSPDGKLLASSPLSDRPVAVALWDVASRKQIKSFKSEAFIISIAFSPGGKLLA